MLKYSMIHYNPSPPSSQNRNSFRLSFPPQFGSHYFLLLFFSSFSPTIYIFIFEKAQQKYLALEQQRGHRCVLTHTCCLVAAHSALILTVVFFTITTVYDILLIICASLFFSMERSLCFDILYKLKHSFISLY